MEAVQNTETGPEWAVSAQTARPHLLALFAEVLQLPETEVDPAADFFALGGHSVSAGRIIGAVRRETGVRVSLVAFFEDPTLQGLEGLVVAGATRG